MALQPTRLVSRLAHISPVRFVIVGCLSLATNTVLLFVLHGELRMNLSIATTLSFLASFVVNFGLNRAWTFESDGSVIEHLWRYLALVLANLGVNNALEIGLTRLGLRYLIAQVLTTGLLALVNYLVSRRWIFTRVEPVSEPAGQPSPAGPAVAVLPSQSSVPGTPAALGASDDLPASHQLG